MSDPFLSEIRMVGFNFAPRGWAFCNGQILPISQNQALYSLLGTTYGGDGRTNFALPDMRGRAPVHMGNGPGLSDIRLGQRGGTERHGLTEQQTAHTHALPASSDRADQTSPEGGVWAVGGAAAFGEGRGGSMAAVVDGVGGSLSHENMQPYLAVYFCIALQGLFPSR